MSFKEWFDTNWYSNCFTMITVVLSGIVSLIISAVYYHKGNRNNLKMSVIYPIVRLLKDGYTRQNYNSLCEISKEYSTRYMSKNEAKKLMLLLLIKRSALIVIFMSKLLYYFHILSTS